MDRGTLFRTVALGITLLNQLLIQFGLEPLQGDQEHWYEVISTIATIVISSITFFKNNYITFRGRQQREVLVKNGLAEK